MAETGQNIAGIAGITDPDLIKLFTMQSMPAAIAWGEGEGGMAGSRSQEQTARRTLAQFNAMGGQAELDRITAKVMSDPVLSQQWRSVVAAGNKGDVFSKIGDWAVSKVPTALKIAAAAGGADIAMGGSLFGAGAGAGATGATGASQGMSAAELAAADPYLASISGASGITPAMEAASATGAAAAPGAMAGLPGNIASAGMDIYGSAASLPSLAQAGITPEILQAATTSPDLMQKLSSLTGMSSNTLSSIASGAASIFGASQASKSAADAAAAQRQATDAALAEQKRQFDAAQAAQMPWRAAGETALGEQMNLMGLGPQGAAGSLASLTASPGYEFRLGEGTKALERSAAAKGGLFSGSAGKALTRFGQDYATGEYGNRLSQLSSLSGQGQSAASGQAGLGMQYGGNVSNLLTNMGTAKAASNIAQGQARQAGILGVGQSLSNIFNPPKQQNTLADLLKGANYGY
jgi:hypothetical protein